MKLILFALLWFSPYCIAMDLFQLPEKLQPKTHAAKELFAYAQKMVKNKQDLNAPVWNDQPLLCIAALSNEHFATAYLLLSHGAEPDIQNSFGHTPLLTACHECAHRIIGLLVHFNANPNHPCYQSGTRVTPLHVLCSPYQDSFNATQIMRRQHAVEWLLAARANTNAQDIHGATPFFGLLACYQKNRSSVLLPPQEKAEFQRARKQLINAFLACHADPTQPDNRGFTAFIQSSNQTSDPYLGIYASHIFKKRREKLREVLLTFLKTSPNKSDALSPFKGVPGDILRYILKIAYP